VVAGRVLDAELPAKAGDKVRIRFELGNDGCTGVVGWFIDDFEYYRCK